MEAVTLRHVDKSYTTYGTEVVLTGQVRPSRTRQVLRDVSVSFPAGSLTAIVGRSGCVPSTSRTYPITATRRAPPARSEARGHGGMPAREREITRESG